MMDSQFSHTSIPLYAQIAERLKMDVAAGRLVAGQRLPTVRETAQRLNVNPGTVARAYGELERDGILQTRRGGGTFVSTRPADNSLDLVREERLSAIFNRSILEGLGLGYTPEELESLFLLYLARWREERARKIDSGRTAVSVDTNTIVFAGSHDLALELLSSHIRRQYPKYSLSSTYVGSLEGLIALEQNQAHLCGMHLLDEETGEYNIPFIRRLLPGQTVILVNLAYRIQGFMVPKGNPKGIRGFADLTRDDVTYVNRHRGSGTRVLLDHNLKELNIKSIDINDYNHEVDTHVAVAATVAGRTADVGLGIEAAAQAANIDFIPVAEEQYDLVIPQDVYDSELLAPLLSTVRSERFKQVLTTLRGYRTEHAGEATEVLA